MNEFTGDFYKCVDCFHVWDFNDFYCPECGSSKFEDINIHEELKATKEKVSDIAKMIEAHDA